MLDTILEKIKHLFDKKDPLDLVPKPRKKAKKFDKYARKFDSYLGWHDGYITVKKFLKVQQ